MPHRRRQRGTFTIEFALIFPALVGVMFLLIDGGRLMGSRVMLSQATIAAARTACLSSTAGPGDLDTAVRDAAPMLASGISVGITACAGGCGTPKDTGDVVTVTATYPFNPGFFKYLAKTLSQTTRVVCE
jgi:Flp pilus assembly protein TadG